MTLELDHAKTIEFPLRGEWTVFNSPGERVPSHSTDYFGQRYAFDFSQLNEQGATPYHKPLWHHLLGLVRVEDCCAWGQPVYAPFAGEIVGVGDGWPDRQRLSFLPDAMRSHFFAPKATAADYRPLTGNYVLLAGEPGVALFAHLQCDSVAVSVGHQVEVGAMLGRVGNSGNSTLPHLRFQLMDGRDPLQAKGIPCKFRTYQRSQADDHWETIVEGIPGVMETIRVESGMLT
ncbi:MAG: M23 family metallopeptidase [Leptolyngbyaceae cyanobacterium bins.349]|nr:M23 family metallopeptidase [Leptolyngbyaceae cyanobacterium bins.349]